MGMDFKILARIPKTILQHTKVAASTLLVFRTLSKSMFYVARLIDYNVPVFINLKFQMHVK